MRIIIHGCPNAQIIEEVTIFGLCDEDEEEAKRYWIITVLLRIRNKAKPSSTSTSTSENNIAHSSPEDKRNTRKKKGRENASAASDK